MTPEQTAAIVSALLAGATDGFVSAVLGLVAVLYVLEMMRDLRRDNRTT